MESCLTENTVVCFASGHVAAEERPRIESHLGQCGACMDALAAAAAYLQSEHAGSTWHAAEPLRQRSTSAVHSDYALIRPLGGGGMGVVYEASQRSTGRRVALKTVRPWVDGAVEALRREAQTLRAISHPGVVGILDQGTLNGVPFFVMELIEGRSFSAALAARRSPPDRIAVTTLTLLRKVCSTLALLHDKGIVHRDVNPRNILLRQPDVPVLVDFGLVGRFAVSSGRDVLEIAGVTMGTLAYMAPEQIRGDSVDPRADLYALGCVLYQVLTGRPPFVESSLDAMIRAQLHQPPTPPSEFCPVPARLEQLVLRLLAKQAKQRVAYAEEVAAELAECGAEDWAPASTRRGQPPHLHRPKLVGREQWLRDVRGAVQRCHAGRGDRFFISGLSGSGKTRLLGELATLARKQGMCVVAAECSGVAQLSPHTSPPEPAALQALRPLLRELAARCRENWAAAEQLMGPAGQVLAEYEPELEELLGRRDEPKPTQVPNDWERLRLFSTLRDTLSLMSRERPVLLVFDDMQRIDPLSLEFLGSLSTRYFEQTRVLILGAYRSEEAGSALQAALQLVAGAQHRELDRLDADAVAAMLRHMLAIESVPSAVAIALQRQSVGNPFFVTEYVRMAVAEGWLVRTEQATWEFVASCEKIQLDRLPVPTTILELIACRLDNLSTPARSLLQLSSVLGRSFRLADLTGASGLQRSSVLELLDELVARQMLEPSETDSLRFVHDKIRETVYAHD